MSLLTLSSYPRAILHVDADAFFASCEQAQDPRLKGRPVVTGGERGIIACASYEAKALGIKRGVRLDQASRLCPELVVLPSDYQTYSIYSERMLTILRQFTPMVEAFSIDEAFCDITGLRRLHHASYPLIGQKIKAAVQDALGITVSVGLSASKTLAKICSRWKKPDGFTALPVRKLDEFLPQVPLEMVCGFGPNTVELLAKCGIRRVYDYIARPVSFARKLLGKIGDELWHELRGEAVYPISLSTPQPLSISKSKTFVPPSCDRGMVKAQMMRNLENACAKLRRHELEARILTIHLRSIDFRQWAVEGYLSRHSSSTLDFARALDGLFDAIFRPGCMYRASGVILTDILPQSIDSRTLFDDPVKVMQTNRLSESMDEVNAKFGKYAVHLAATAPALIRDKSMPRNAPCWRTATRLKGETARRRIGVPLLKH